MVGNELGRAIPWPHHPPLPNGYSYHSRRMVSHAYMSGIELLRVRSCGLPRLFPTRFANAQLSRHRRTLSLALLPSLRRDSILAYLAASSSLE